MAPDAPAPVSGDPRERMKRLLEEAETIHQKLHAEVGDATGVRSAASPKTQTRAAATHGQLAKTLAAKEKPSVLPPHERQSYLHDVESNLQEVRLLLDQHVEKEPLRRKWRGEEDEVSTPPSRDTAHDLPAAAAAAPQHAQSAHRNDAEFDAVTTSERGCQTDTGLLGGAPPLTPQAGSPTKSGDFKMSPDQRADFEQLSSVRDTMGKKLNNLRVAYKGLADRERQAEWVDVDEMRRNLEFYEEERVYLYSKIFGCHPSKFPEGATRHALPDLDDLTTPLAEGPNHQLQRDLEAKVKANKRLTEKVTDLHRRAQKKTAACRQMRNKLQQIEYTCFTAHEALSREGGGGGGQGPTRRKRDTGAIQTALPSGGLFDQNTDEHVAGIMRYADLKTPHLDTHIKGLIESVRSIAVRTDQVTMRTLGSVVGMAKPQFAGSTGDVLRKHQETMHEVLREVEKTIKQQCAGVLRVDREHAGNRRQSTHDTEGLCRGCGGTLALAGEDAGAPKEVEAPVPSGGGGKVPPLQPVNRKSVVGLESPKSLSPRGTPAFQKFDKAPLGQSLRGTSPGDAVGSPADEVNPDVAMLSFEKELLQDENDAMKEEIEDLQRQVEEWRDKYNALLEESQHEADDGGHSVDGDDEHDVADAAGAGGNLKRPAKGGRKRTATIIKPKGGKHRGHKPSDAGRPPASPAADGDESPVASGAGGEGEGAKAVDSKSAGYGKQDTTSGKLFSQADAGIRPIYQKSLAFHHVLVRFLDKLRQLLQIPDVLIQSRVQLIQQREKENYEKSNPDDLTVRVQKLVNKDRTVLVAFADILRKDAVNANKLGAVRRAIHKDHEEELDQAGANGAVDGTAPRKTIKSALSLEHGDEDGGEYDEDGGEVDDDGLAMSVRGPGLDGSVESPRPTQGVPALKRSKWGQVSKALKERCPTCGQVGFLRQQMKQNRERDAAQSGDDGLDAPSGSPPVLFVAAGETQKQQETLGTAQKPRLSRLFPTVAKLDPHDRLSDSLAHQNGSPVPHGARGAQHLGTGSVLADAPQGHGAYPSGPSAVDGGGHPHPGAHPGMHPGMHPGAPHQGSMHPGAHQGARAVLVSAPGGGIAYREAGIPAGAAADPAGAEGALSTSLGSWSPIGGGAAGMHRTPHSFATTSSGGAGRAPTFAGALGTPAGASAAGSPWFAVPSGAAFPGGSYPATPLVPGSPVATTHAYPADPRFATAAQPFAQPMQGGQPQAAAAGAGGAYGAPGEAAAAYAPVGAGGVGQFNQYYAQYQVKQAEHAAIHVTGDVDAAAPGPLKNGPRQQMGGGGGGGGAGVVAPPGVALMDAMRQVQTGAGVVMRIREGGYAAAADAAPEHAGTGKCQEWFEAGHGNTERAAGAAPGGSPRDKAPVRLVGGLAPLSFPGGDAADDGQFPPIQPQALALGPAGRFGEQSECTPLQMPAVGLPSLGDGGGRAAGGPSVRPVAMDRRKSEKLRIQTSVEEEAKSRAHRLGVQGRASPSTMGARTMDVGFGLQGVTLNGGPPSSPVNMEGAGGAIKMQPGVKGVSHAELQLGGEQGAGKQREMLVRTQVATQVEARRRKISLTVTNGERKERSAADKDVQAKVVQHLKVGGKGVNVKRLSAAAPQKNLFPKIKKALRGIPE